VQQLENGDAAPVHLLTSHNFWVLTRYNRSSYYALAVLLLGERLQQLREAR
jgi:membrane-bound lytic murein transglycosylase B